MIAALFRYPELISYLKNTDASLSDFCSFDFDLKNPPVVLNIV